MSITSNEILFPVGGMFMKLPLCVPENVPRAQTLSPWETRSLTATPKSGNPVLSAPMSCFNPSTPDLNPGGGGSCSTKFRSMISSTTLSLPFENTSSYMRRNNDSFETAGIPHSPAGDGELGDK